MNPVSTGCGDNVEDGKGNSDGSATNTTGGWFWISDLATNKNKMRTSQSTSSLQLFTIKSAKTNTSKPDKGAAENRCVDVSDDRQDEAVNDDGSLVGRDVVIRRSVSLINITAVDKDGVREESGMATVTPTEEKDVDLGCIKLKGFGDVGVDKENNKDHSSASFVDSKEEDGPPETESDIRKNAEMEERDNDRRNGRKQDHVDEFKKLFQLEEKLTKSQATMRMLRKTNIRYQDEIAQLTTNLADESETRRALHEELAASRKLCCELYENLLQERTKRRSTEILQVERHLSPETLNFSLSDAAVQTDVELVEFCNRNTHQNPLYTLRDSENVSTSLLPTEDIKSFSKEIPQYSFYLYHLLEEFQENQKNLEVQLKSLSEQCREKDEDLKIVKEKMGGHIRLNTLLQSEKVCLEETVEQLREEIKSCDHLIQSCDSVLREKDREIRELQVAKYALERRVAEFEFKEKEFQGMVSGFQDDIGDLALQRKKLRKCVKKASKHHSPKQQVKVHESAKRTDEKEIELQAKAELLNAIREIAFKCSPSPTKPTPQLKVDKAITDKPFKHQPKTHSTGDEGKKSYTARSIKESIVVTSENSLIVKETSTCSVSQSISTDDALDSKLEDERSQCAQPTGKNSNEYQWRDGHWQERSICTDQQTHGHLSAGNMRELTRKKVEKKKFHDGSHLLDIAGEKLKTKSVKKESMRASNGQDVTASGVIQRSIRHSNTTLMDSLEDDEERDEVTLSCQNLYSDVMNELSCKNAAAAMATVTTATEHAEVEPCPGTDGRYGIGLEDVSSKDNKGQLHVKPVDWMSSVDSLAESSYEDYQNYLHDSEADIQHTSNKTTGARKVIAFLDDDDDDDDDDIFSDDDDNDFDFKFSQMQEHISSNNSNESKYDEGSNLKTAELYDKYPDSAALTGGTKQDATDEITDLALGIETTDNPLSLESPQRVEDIEKGNLSRSHGLTSYQCGDDLQDDDLEFCVTDEECDALEEDEKWQVGEDESSDISSDFLTEDPTVLRDERGQENFSTHQKKVKEVTGGQQKGNKVFQNGQDPCQTQSPNPVKMQRDIRNRHVQHSSIDPVDSGRQTRHCINSGRKIMGSGITSSYREIKEDSVAPFSVCHSPHGWYDSPEKDNDDLHLGDAEWDESSHHRDGDASPAEGLILRKQVMENYATRAANRAWHYIYMSQDGPSLMFYKDRMGKELGVQVEEPLTLTNAIISVAKDYIKRKHVFRVQLPNGHQYLFSARDDREMMYWICRLDAAGAPPSRRRGKGYSCLPAIITTIPPPTNGSPTRSERLQNFIKGGISALLK